MTDLIRGRIYRVQAAARRVGQAFGLAIFLLSFTSQHTNVMFLLRLLIPSIMENAE